MRTSSQHGTQTDGQGHHAVPAETIISTTLADDDQIHAVLALIQSPSGLNVISVERVSS
jgi:hypothetical protein